MGGSIHLQGRWARDFAASGGVQLYSSRTHPACSMVTESMFTYIRRVDSASPDKLGWYGLGKMGPVGEMINVEVSLI